MCVVCVLWEKDKLTLKEADSAFSELIDGPDADSWHAIEALEKMREEDGK